MSPELCKRFKNGESPFNGKSVVTCDDPEIEMVRQMVEYCIDQLAENSNAVMVTHDWHEHDGFILPANRTTWDECRKWVKTAETFYESRDRDFGVRIAMYPPSLEWLLRFNIDDEDEPDWITAWADMDFSVGDNPTAIAIAASLNSSFPGYTEMVNTKEYFDNSYGG